jgi:hypothetical protein
MDSRILLAVLALTISISTNGWLRPAAADDLLEVIPADEIFHTLSAVPVRERPPPDTPEVIPHQQFSRNAPLSLQEELMASVSVLPGVRVVATEFSLAGSQGWRLEDSFAEGPDDAFISQSREFGHLHQPADGSMHMLLPVGFSVVALEKGWGIIHPLTDSISGENSDYVMIFGPRDQDELKTILDIPYGKINGRVLSLDAVQPERRCENGHPVALWLHGGGWQSRLLASGATLSEQAGPGGD